MVMEVHKLGIYIATSLRHQPIPDIKFPHSAAKLASQQVYILKLGFPPNMAVYIFQWVNSNSKLGQLGKCPHVTVHKIVTQRFKL